MKLPWRSTPTVFIASTSERAMEAYRETAGRAARRTSSLVEMHEDWSPDQQRTVAACRARVDRCDALVLIVGGRYGYVPSPAEGGDGTSSITQIEVAHAKARGIPVYAFLARTSRHGRVTVAHRERVAARAGLAAFKRDLKRGLAKIVHDEKEIEPLLVKIFLDLRHARYKRNIVATGLLAAVSFAAIVGTIVWSGGPTEQQNQEPPPARAVYGRVTTKKGVAAARATVALGCRQDRSTRTNDSGQYVLPLADIVGDCRDAPFALVVTTDDGQTFKRDVPRADAGDMQVDDPPYRLTAFRGQGYALYAAELDGSATNAGAYAVATLSRSMPVVHALYVQQRDGRPSGVIVASAPLPQDSAISLEPLDDAHLAAALTEWAATLRAGGSSGLATLNTVLTSLFKARVSISVVGSAFRTVGITLAAKSCDEWRVKVHWLEQSERVKPMSDVARVLIESRARTTSACRRD